ncbi:BatA domain-containing protein [Luteirhabdus pelagi]|uniref:BatA domain-containing protein n=1 Tax=Luteirhabdus pelagi TaxID=2792783 RepID=UPI00193A98CE|nr:BatA domain-containing protein [Luteirhabdus pelagi]
MQFKHPELLYALFALLIPILIHLFQLRRFQKTEFTNVAFLKRISLQTRKSSKLKKWLTLFLRLAALACIIIAFAQPYQASDIALDTEKETVLYLDNSFSMQAKGSSGALLQRSINQLMDRDINANKFSWFTNTETYKEESPTDFREKLRAVDYTSTQLSLPEVLVKAQQLFSGNSGVKRLIIISDLQARETLPEVPSDIQLDVISLQPENRSNIALDTAYIETRTVDEAEIKVVVSGQESNTDDIPVSLFQGETLIAKSAVDLSTARTAEVSFTLPISNGFQGAIQVSEPNMPFDNTLYLNINKPEKIKVMSINEGDASFLQRLFEVPECEYTQQEASFLNYNEIPNQNLIILNGLKTIPNALQPALVSFVENGGSVAIIPGNESDRISYNSLLQQLRLPILSEIATEEKNVTNIQFSHPLYENVFEKEVVNFQYPTVQSHYPLASAGASTALTFSDGSPFLVQSGTSYLFSAAFNQENSNFKSSPLIVPTFFNMAQQSLSLPTMYAEIGIQNTFDIPVSLQQDEIVKVQGVEGIFIPLQQSKANKVVVTTTDQPSDAGTYRVLNKDETIQYLSYNYSRSEGKLQYANVDDWNGAMNFSSIDELFSAIAQENDVQQFWKWFVIFASVFLLAEMLVLKYYKDRKIRNVKPESV